MKEANKILNSKYLNGCSLYVTLEPCLMCQYAARLSRVENIYFLLSSSSFGDNGPGYGKTRLKQVDQKFSQESLDLLQNFFKNKR